MRRVLAVVLLSTVSAVTAPTSAAAQTASAPAAISYPQTKTVDVVDTQFGVPVADPYRCLENDVRNEPLVEAWVTAENEVTNRFLQALPLRDWFTKRMTALYDYERYGLPVKKGKLYFFTHNLGLQNQSPLYVSEGSNGRDRLLIDPNAWSKDNATALAEWTP